MQENLEKNGVTMAESERRTKEREFGELNRDFQRKQREFREDLNLRQNEEMAGIFERANKVIKQIAEAEKFDLIVQEAVYVSPRIDITDKVIKALSAKRLRQANKPVLAHAMARSLDEIVARFGGESAAEIRAASFPGSRRWRRRRRMQLSFLANPKYRNQLDGDACRRGHLVRRRCDRLRCDAIVTPQPYLYFARVSQWLANIPRPAPGVHPAAVVESPVPASAVSRAACLDRAGCRDRHRCRDRRALPHRRRVADRRR